MNEKRKLPVGIESFEEIRREGFYYVDKTNMIRDLLKKWSKVNLFTRPRRFGKSLNMSMLKSFFEIGQDPSLFDGLDIMKETELCDQYMGKYPVISISLKSIDAADYATARNLAVKMINEEARRLRYLLKSPALSPEDKELFSLLLKKEMDDETLICSIRELSELLRRHFNRKVIILIDEYDVPLSRANVISYCDELTDDADARPRDYWSNTSSNDVVRHFIDKLDDGLARSELEALIAGETVSKEIHEDLTYNRLYDSMDHIWSVLFAAGYLTQRGQPEGKTYRLSIPNMEIRNIFTEQIMAMFKKEAAKDGERLRAFCSALETGDAKQVETLFTAYLKKTVGIRDTFCRKPLRENFYHGILLGILGFKSDWYIQSNKEAGDGYSDILIRTEDENIGIIIEIKYAQSGQLQTVCERALLQIENRHYDTALKTDGCHTILKYGIACYRRECRVLLGS